MRQRAWPETAVCGRPLEASRGWAVAPKPVKSPETSERGRQRKRGGRAIRTTAVWDKQASVDKTEKGVFMWSCSRTSDKSSHIHTSL